MPLIFQVITSAEFHPSQCNIFAYSSSKGCIRLADMRSAALCDRHAKAFEEVESQVSSTRLHGRVHIQRGIIICMYTSFGKAIKAYQWGAAQV
jgi:hypothetical protein